MLITLVGLVLVVLAAVYVAWPLLAGSAPEEVAESPLGEASNLEKEKDAALLAIRDADVILVMEHGSIVEQGSHASLLAAGGAYARLYSAQFAAAVAEVD